MHIFGGYIMETGNSFHAERFAENLKFARNRKQITQKDLAAMIGIHVRTIINWEGGKSTTKGNISVPRDTEVLIKLCEVLDCDIDFLLGKITTLRHETTDICEATGLSKESVEKLLAWHNAPNDISKHYAKANLEFIDEIIPQIPFSISGDYLSLQATRAYIDKVISFASEEEADQFAELSKAYPTGLIMSRNQANRFLISEIGKAIEDILRKGSASNEA